MSSDNPVSDLAEGAARGLLDWSAEKIATLVQRLRDRKLAFIAEQRTVEVVREQYNSGEAKFYRKYIKDKDLLFLVRMGLTLRKIEDDDERLQNLRTKIHDKFGIQGLHIAQFVQNGILNRYFGLLIEQLASEDELEKRMYEILVNVDQHALFVPATSKVAEVIRKVSVVIDAHSPSIFVIAGSGVAVKIVSESTIALEKVMEGYGLERFSGVQREVLFFRRTL